MYINDSSILRVPDHCAILTKTLEISKSSPSTNYSNSLKLVNSEKVTLHVISKKSPENLILKTVFLNETDLKPFERNNNETIDLLSSISTSPFSTTETMLIASTSSVSLLVISLIALITIVYCSRHCKTSHQSTNNPVVVVVDKEKVKGRNLHRSADSIHRNSVDLESDQINSPKENADMAKRLDDFESKKPPFHRKI
jgi:hypothetical protein